MSATVIAMASTPKPGTMSRAEIHERYKKILAQLAPYYEDDESALMREVNEVRRGDPGAVGDFSVIIWGLAQLELYRAKSSEA